MAKDTTTTQPDKPKVYVTRRGELYIKGDELLKSKSGREAIRKAAEAMEKWPDKREKEGT